MIVVLDLEATCWEPGQGYSTREAEVIEIGALKLSAGSFEEVDRFETLVYPTKHPFLSPYCTALTGIESPMLRQAPRFEEAYHRLVKFCGRRNQTMLAAWGQYDRTLLRIECERWGIVDQLPHEYLNLSTLFQKITGCPKKLSLQDALLWLGVEVKAPFHRALPDAWHAARVLKALLNRPDTNSHELTG